jgi:tRNA(Ile)-lysidine synthase
MGNKTFTLDSKWNFLAEKHIFIACSGGVDSIVLANLISGICPNITLLHVNYNLRGQASIEDQYFVEQFALANKLKLEVKSIDTLAMLEEKQQNTQELARTIRYTWFKEKLENPKSVLLLGHHKDDQIETFFLNLSRNSGLKGLCCMLEENNPIYRPLLPFSKKEILDFASENKIKWREDASNSTNKYRRNKLRNTYLPFLQQEIPSLGDSVILLIQKFQEELKRIKKEIKFTSQKAKNDEKIDFSEFDKLSTDELILFLEEFGFSARQLSEFEKLRNTAKGKQIESENFIVQHDVTHFSIYQKTKLILPKLLIEEVKKEPKIFTKNEIYISKETLVGKPQIRFWKNGDRINPIGLHGSQLISDIIKDAKISNFKKKSVCVVHDDQKILWLVGLKVSKYVLNIGQVEELLKISCSTL